MAEGGSQGTLVSGVAQRYATALFELAEENVPPAHRGTAAPGAPVAFHFLDIEQRQQRCRRDGR